MSEQVGANTIQANNRKASVAGGIGIVVENYDFVLYGTFASSIGSAFFSSSDPTISLLETFAVFGVGFFVRPLGGIFFGHVADRRGRRTALAYSVLLTSLSTFLIGILPTYATVGVLATVLLVILRLAQGFCAAGEYAGANTFVVEYSAQNRRGRAAAIVPFCVGFGLLFGAAFSVLLGGILGSDALVAWGWRVPFMLAAPIGVVGLILRLRIDDSPEFKAAKQHGEVVKLPLVLAFRKAKRSMLVLFVWASANAVAFYMLSGYFVSYLTETSGFSHFDGTLAYGFGIAAFCAFSPVAGVVADYIGRKPLVLVSAAGSLVWAYPSFFLMNSGNFVAAVVGVCVYGALLSGIVTTTSLALVELFPTAIRVSGGSMAYNLAYSIFGGSAAFVATALTASMGPQSPAVYLIVILLAGIVAAALGIGNSSRRVDSTPK